MLREIDEQRGKSKERLETRAELAQGSGDRSVLLWHFLVLAEAAHAI